MRHYTQDEFMEEVDKYLRSRYPVEYASGKIGPTRDAAGKITGFKGIRIKDDDFFEKFMRGTVQ